MTSDPSDFDLNAAWLRRSQGDLGAFMEGLAVRLETALPGCVEVERRREGFFAKQTHVARIAVTLDTRLLTLEHQRGRLRAKLAKVVHGVTIGSDDIPVPAWLEALIRATQAASHEAGAAQGVLHDFLMS